MDDFTAGAATTRDTLRYCVDLARPYSRLLLVGAVCLVLGVLINDVATPLVFAAVLDRIATIGPHTRMWPRFGDLIIAYAALVVAGQVAWRFSGWYEWEGSLKTFANGIHRSFERLLDLGYRWHVDHAAGEVASSLSSFSWALVDGLDILQWGVLRIVVVVISATVVTAVVAWPVALVLLALSAVFVVIIVKRSGPVTAASRQFSEAHSRAEGDAADAIRNVSTILSAATEPAESARIEGLLAASVRADLRARRAFTITRVWMGGTISLMTWGALLVGVLLAVQGDIRAGVIYLVLFYASQVSTQMVESFEQIRNLTRGLGRAAKLVGLVSTPPEVVDDPAAGELAVREASLRFEHVRFSYYPTRPLLSDFDLAVNAGEHVGVVGPSGGGKSTVTRLVLRFMDLDGGRITIDGQDIAGVTQASLRRAISYVPQDPQMLHRSIADNIWYGKGGEVDLALVDAVARDAHVEEFVRHLPAGYHTVVGERGLKLSGGQRQRVAIAQAMLKAAPVLILDEATSALDSESERYVQDALWRLMARATALVVAHRLSTIAQLDRIVVVDDGRIVEVGTHRDLLDEGRSPGLYRELWQRQSGGFISV
ncbi:MAG: ABC transporter ATP-binding protein/permease [Acidimicrobiaceae bacterium]|nr:ABC transporter ATP-binding protein/permease [Acidimicrobiaceae bacterium]